MQSFLIMINKWWTIANSKTRFSANPLASAIVKDDGKVEFLQSLADWFSSWSKTRSGLCLSQQTFQAMVLTLQAQAHLVTDLLQEGYEFVIPAKFQSDPLEQRFSQYRQMSGGNCLVSLREVLNSEKTLLCKSLLKEGDGVLEEMFEDTHNTSEMKKFCESFLKIFDEVVTDNIALCKGSEEVAVTISGYIAKKLLNRLKCELRTSFMVENSSTISYYNHLSRGNLTVPSSSLADFGCSAFALLDYFDDFMTPQDDVNIRDAGFSVLLTCLPQHNFSCEVHQEVALKLAIRMIVNIYYNNKQKRKNDSIEKDAITGFKKRQKSKYFLCFANADFKNRVKMLMQYF